MLILQRNNKERERGHHDSLGKAVRANDVGLRFIMDSTQQSEIEHQVQQVVERLAARLDRNLYSCLLYGSVVRGDHVNQVSDINLLLVLEESTPAAHALIADSIGGTLRIAPFIVGRRGIDRTIRAFATKFLSIRRN